MERTKYLLVMVLITIGCQLIAGNNQSVYKAYTSGNMSKWKQTIDSIEARKQKSNKELLDLVNYQYGYIAWCIGNKKIDEAEKYLDKAINNVALLKQKNYNESLLYAYNAAFVGFEIGMAQYKAPFIGHKSLEYANKSIVKDTKNALGYMQLGNIAYYTPSIFGGSKTEALNHYLKALSIMESNNEYHNYNWNYLNLLATLISAYMDLNKYEEARKYCIKTLKIEPNFDWVKNKLYPEILKKL